MRRGGSGAKGCPGVLAWGSPPARPGAAGKPLSISDQPLGLPEAGPVREGHRNQDGGCQADWLPMNGGPEQGQWGWGRGCGPHMAGEAGFPGNSEVGGRAEGAPADGAERRQERGRRVPRQSLQLLRAPQPRRLPKGSATQGQGAVTPHPQLLHQLSPSVDQRALLTLPASLPRLTSMFCCYSASVQVTLDLFGLAFPSVKWGQLRAPTSRGCWEGSVRAPQESTGPAPRRHAAHRNALGRCQNGGGALLPGSAS